MTAPRNARPPAKAVCPVKQCDPDKSSDSLAGPRQPCVGLEAEFSVLIDGKKRLPEEVFGNPRHIVRAKMIPRTGRSWHLPSGGALYFDTGVLEVATPVIEVAPGCAVRAGRSLWEQIFFLRKELDAWEKAHSTQVRLEGFSAHYNLSVPSRLDPAATRRLALLLTYLLPAPVMLLAANRASTGIGVRPRADRIEVTADFTPDPDLMVATASLITGIALAVAEWPDYSVREIQRRNFPRIADFRPRRHTSRKGYLARFDCFPANPFTTDPNIPAWRLTDGRSLSLRQIALSIAAPFRDAIRSAGDPAAYQQVFDVLEGRTSSLMDLPERPQTYGDIGRSTPWRHPHHLTRSRYEKVIRRVLALPSIRIDSTDYQPEQMLGWFEIAFRNLRTGQRAIFTLDQLAAQQESQS